MLYFAWNCRLIVAKREEFPGMMSTSYLFGRKVLREKVWWSLFWTMALIIVTPTFNVTMWVFRMWPFFSIMYIMCYYYLKILRILRVSWILGFIGFLIIWKSFDFWSLKISHIFLWLFWFLSCLTWHSRISRIYSGSVRTTTLQ